MLVSCSNIMSVSKLIGPNILWYLTSTLLNIIEALLLEILAERWNNCQRCSYTHPQCTRIAKASTLLEQSQKSSPSDIIHLPYSGTPKAYSTHWLDYNSKVPVYVSTQYFYRKIECTIRTASKFRSWQYRPCMGYNQDIQKGSTCDGIRGTFPDSTTSKWPERCAVGKILLITSNLPSLCMHSMIWHESHSARIKFLMPFQWCTLFCATSTVWEHTVASCHFCPLNCYHVQVKHKHTNHESYD